MISQKKLMAALQSLRKNPSEDAVLDLMDRVEGWTSPHSKLGYSDLTKALIHRAINTELNLIARSYARDKQAGLYTKIWEEQYQALSIAFSELYDEVTDEIEERAAMYAS